MRPFFCLLLLALALSFGGCAQPSRTLTDAAPAAADLDSLPRVAGILSADLVLEGALVLADDLLVPAGVTLVLRPGTRVYVVPSESTKIEPEWLSSATELLVRGTLRSEGTAEQPVVFEPLSSSAGTVYAWAGLLLDGATDSLIRHTRIQNAEQGVLCINSSPEIRDSRIFSCRYGITAQQQSSPTLVGNLLQGGEAGVFCWNESHPLIQDNHIVGHNEEGLFIDRGSRPRLLGNRITGNGIGLALYDPGLAGAADQVRGNRQDLRLLGLPGGRP